MCTYSQLVTQLVTQFVCCVLLFFLFPGLEVAQRGENGAALKSDLFFFLPSSTCPSLPPKFGAQPHLCLSGCCVGAMQNMDSWVWVMRGTLFLSLRSVMYSAAGG